MANAIGLSLGTDVSLNERSCSYTEYSTSCYTAGTDGNRVISEEQFNFMVVEMESAAVDTGYTGICYTAENMGCGDENQYTCTTRAIVYSETSTELGTCALDHIATAYKNLYSECGAAGGVRSVLVAGEGGNVVDYTLYATTDTVDACPSSYLRTAITCDDDCYDDDLII
ncbi:hypothetical protein N7520_001175 [Penicillium odoratum]|uniref:uncharacterized protein n=1 Tax=Penicillium odoratum TaxID=1167516 RepID=UPI002548EA6D|nr:uncharacterized protein N7520_001175 [Penicillium odoratum]KAJ5777929.1 hypothetical protein N7520_001175 [Penicillium odoratum]